MKKILVIVDMQNDFTTGSLGNPDCVAVISKIVDLVRSKQYDRVFLTQDTHAGDYLNTQEGKRLPVVHCIKDTEGWQIVKPIMNACMETYSKDNISIIEKPAFGCLTLAEGIKEYCTISDIPEIHFAGVCTGICVISNVLITKAAVPEARVCVIENACACVTPASHRNAIEAMKTCQVDII